MQKITNERGISIEALM